MLVTVVCCVCHIFAVAGLLLLAFADDHLFSVPGPDRPRRVPSRIDNRDRGPAPVEDARWRTFDPCPPVPRHADPAAMLPTIG